MYLKKYFLKVVIIYIYIFIYIHFLKVVNIYIYIYIYIYIHYLSSPKILDRDTVKYCKKLKVKRET